MAETKNALLPWLRLLRAGTLFSPGCDVVAGICVVVATEPYGSVPPTESMRAAAASIGLYAAGMVWNDVADRRVDAVQRPERPLPSGQVSAPAAIALGTGLIAAALLCTPALAHHVAIAVLVLAYDFVCKRSHLLGAVTMGSLRCLNLLTVASFARYGVIDDFVVSYGDAGFLMCLPRSLLTAAICYGLYIFAVTILGILEDAPSPRRSHVLLVQSIPPLAALTGIAVVQGGIGLAPLLALLPIALFVRRMLRIATWDQRAIRGSMLWLLLGTMLYTALLALAAGSWPAALGIALCIAPARWIARRISLT
jgi:4-hydroxybenzoate polyprenyltransferase